MSPVLSSDPRMSLRKPLAAALASSLMLSVPMAGAAGTTWTVNTCADTNTTGSLRYAINNAAGGDTVDMTGLACSTISLVTGALVIGQTQTPLTINGPGADKLAIDATLSASRVIDDEVAGGKLYLNYLSLSHGTHAPASALAAGGCLYSQGSVYLNHVDVRYCSAIATGTYSARGGAIFVQASAAFLNSSVHDNTATALGTGVAYGGAFANDIGFHSFVASYSTFSHNHAIGSGPTKMLAGALRLKEGGVISNSTIAGNDAGSDGGVLVTTSAAVNHPFTLLNSTVSGNTSADEASGVLAVNINTTIANSTIAFNTSSNASAHNIPPLAGLVVNGSYATLTLQSNLIANNLDLNASPEENDVGFSDQPPGTISGNDNLIGGTYLGFVWGTGTISGVCPLLGPLRDNGGPTLTHALLSGSPGIDAGNNAFVVGYDQRGPGYDRLSGSVVDIGAYEVQTDDIIFNATFDGCPAL